MPTTPINEEYEKEIRELIEKNPRYGKMIKSKGLNKNRAKDRTYLLNYIYARTDFLDNVETNLATRIAFCLNHVTEIPKCVRKDCPNKLTKVKVKSAFDMTLKSPHCCKKCERKTAHESNVATCNRKYGSNITNVFQVESVKTKSCKTRSDRYGADYPMQSRKIWLDSKKKYTYNGIKFDSTWEIVYYEYLTKHGIDFEFQPKSDFFYTSEEKTHQYYPDFFLKNSNTYVEIKDSRVFKKYLSKNYVPSKESEQAMVEKMKLVKKLESSRTLVILTEKEMKSYFDWFKEEHGGQRYKEYLRQFKNK